MDPRAQQIRAAGLPFALLTGAFRLLGWLNGGAALGWWHSCSAWWAATSPRPICNCRCSFCWRACWSPAWACCSPTAQVSLLRQGYTGRLGRGHLPAQILAMLCYVASALAFCAACWLAAGQGATDAASQMTTYATL